MSPSLFPVSVPRFLLIGPFGWSELLIILFLVLLFFGPKRLPEVAEAIGKSIRKFKKSTQEIKDEIESQETDLSEGDDKRG
jgi:sec-independent protein translocase protein TatA